VLERGGVNPRGVREGAFKPRVAGAATNVGMFSGVLSFLGADGVVERDRGGVLVLSHTCTSSCVLHKSSDAAHDNENGSGPEEPSARTGNDICNCGGSGTTLMSV
jgi:hypothetical protein